METTQRPTNTHACVHVYTHTPNNFKRRKIHIEWGRANIKRGTCTGRLERAHEASSIPEELLLMVSGMGIIFFTRKTSVK